MSNQHICKLDDIIPETGVCALVNGKQVAIFRTIDNQLYAIDNFDPFSNANVLSRGLIGGTTIKTAATDTSHLEASSPAAPSDTLIDKEVIYVASPIYKQRFDLATGQCLDDDSVSVDTYDVSLIDDNVVVKITDSVEQ